MEDLDRETSSNLKVRNRGRRVHGVLWVIDELNLLALCSDDILAAALEFWRDDSAARLLAPELARRLRLFRRA